MSSIRDFPSYVNQELNLEPPAAIPHIGADDGDSDDEGRYELISFRIPATMDISDLDGVEIDVEAIAESSSGMKLKDGKLAIEAGDLVENQNFRVLVPSSGGNAKNKDDADSSSGFDSDSDSEKQNNNNNNNNKYVLEVAKKAFSRHFNVTENALSRKSETELAPLQTPKAIDDVLRKAYCKIPQRKNLKRRWMPLGNLQIARDLPEKLVTLQPDRKARTVSQSETSEVEEKAVSPNKKTKKQKTKTEKSRRNNVSDASAAATDGGGNAEASPSKKKRVKKEAIAAAAAATPSTPAASDEAAVKSEKKKKKKEAKKQKEKLAKKSRTVTYKKQRSKDKKLVKKESNNDDALSV